MAYDFGQELATCDDFEDDHNEVVVASIDFIGKRSIHLQRGGVLLGTPYEDSISGSLTSSSMVVERKLNIQHYKSRDWR